MPFVPFFEFDPVRDTRPSGISRRMVGMGNLTFRVVGGESGKKRQWCLPLRGVVATHVAMGGMMERPVRCARMDDRMTVASARMGRASDWRGSDSVNMEFIFVSVKARYAGGSRGGLTV